MTSAPSTTRVEIKPVATDVTGAVDGAWWPRSLDLVAELEELAPALRPRLGRIERVSYHLGDWDAVPRRAAVDGSTVKFAGFRFQAPGTVDVLAELHRVTLLVLPSETTPEEARRVLAAASTAGNADSLEDLLSPRGPVA